MWQALTKCGELISIWGEICIFVVNSMKKKIPAFLLEKNQLIGTVIITVFFAVVFLNIYTESSTTAWFELDRSIYFFFTLGFISLATLILVVSRIIMYHTRHFIELTYPGYFLWILIEIFLISCFYAYTTAIYIVHKPDYFSEIFPKGLMCVSIILIVPFTIAALVGAANTQKKTLALQKYEGEEMVHLSDNNGNLKFSIKLGDLFYIESQDNYINVYYIVDGKVKNYMLRCKIKTIEESFAGSSLVRCHRSYIINTDKIRAIRKEKNGTFIELDRDDIGAIPLSKGYASKFSR